MLQELGYTIGQTEPKSPDGRHLSPEKIQRELDRLIIKEDAKNMDVIDWIFVSNASTQTVLKIYE